MSRVRGPGTGGGFTLFEFAVSAAVLGVLAAILLARTSYYRAEADRAAAMQLIASLRAALQLESAKVQRARGERGLRLLAEANPLDLLAEKPNNYLGEYYSPELEKMPGGNWVFDRRDKTLIYLLVNHKSFPLKPSNLLKFKVEFVASAKTSGGTNGSSEVQPGLALKEVEQPADTDK